MYNGKMTIFIGFIWVVLSKIPLHLTTFSSNLKFLFLEFISNWASFEILIG